MDIKKLKINKRSMKQRAGSLKNKQNGDKLLPKLRKRRLQQINSEMKNGGISTNKRKIQRMIRDYCEQLYARK
jgi:hypothetical protein